jgi:putative SOS response-associated peptidase YedK
MCGRFTLARGTPAEIAEAFGLPEPPYLPGLEPRYNVAPTQRVPVVRVVRQDAGGGREAVMMRWGLIPHWSKGDTGRPLLINARAETAAEKPAFRDAFRKRRCLIPADGFFEWSGPARNKRATHFRLKDGGLFALAGLWDSWDDPDGTTIESCAVLTTEANELVRPYHDRMPCILRPEDYGLWLDTSAKDMQALCQLLAPFPAAEMEGVPVGPHVNSAKNEGPQCLST